MLYLHLAPLIVTPGLWIAGPGDLELAALVHQLNAMGAEPIEDAGGWGSLVVGAEWLKPGERPSGMVMDLGEVIRRLTDRAIASSNGSYNDAAKKLGVSRSTMSRWRRGIQDVGIGRKLDATGTDGVGLALVHSFPGGHGGPENADSGA